MEELLRLVTAPDPTLAWHTVLLSLVLAFVLSMVVAKIYVVTHQSLSYSRSFVQALVLGGVVAAMLMMAIGNSVARGIGIVGTLAMIRFRSTMKDPRDMMFVFAALATGVSTGVRAYAVAVAGTAVFSAASWFLRVTDFGSRPQADGLVRIQLPADAAVDEVLKEVLARHCHSWTLVALREADQGHQLEHNYQIKLRHPERHTEFVSELEAIPAARAVSLFLQPATVDV